MGMEMFAVAVVVLLFFMVLKQFSFFEPLSLEGKLSTGSSFTINPILPLCANNHFNSIR